MLVIRRGNTRYLNGFWSVPAGHLEAGETAEQACVRETREEVGVELDVGDLRFALVQQKSGVDGEERVDFFFEAALPFGQRAWSTDTGEVTELAWVERDSLPAPFAPYVLSALSARRKSRIFSAWGYSLPLCQSLPSCSIGFDRRHRSRKSASKDLARGYCAEGVSTRCGISQPWFRMNSAGTFR